MLVEIKDLEVGDIVLTPCQVDFKRLKVLKQPTKNAQGYWKRVKCGIYNHTVNDKNRWASYDCEKEEFNDTISMDLSYRKLWLIKKEETC